MEIIYSMRVFKNVASLGSFSKAADAMDLSPPQVTRTIKLLEEHLGARLFNRTTRAVSLTAEGQRFLERVDVILQELSDATTMFASDTSMFRGRINLDIPAGFVPTTLIRQLHRFSDKYPNIDLRISVTDRTVNLVGEGVDCALRIGELQNSSLIARQIASMAMVTCASPGYLARHGAPESPSDLINHPQVSFLLGSGNKPYLWNFVVDNINQVHVPAGVASTNETTAYIECALSGYGIIQLPGLMIEKHLKEGALVEVLSAFRPEPRALSIVYPSRDQVPPYIKAFFDWIKNFFKDYDSAWLCR
jgi:LysR family transcriptional regulator for bpeEF and oprC